MQIMQAHAEQAAGMLKLLANPSRLLILCQLVKGEKSVGELTELSGLSQSALSQHLARMRAEKLVSCRKSGQQVFYRMDRPEVEAILATLYLIYCK